MDSPTAEFLDSLHDLFPKDSSLPNPWHYVAAIVLAANNRHQDVAAAYPHAISKTEPAGQLDMTRKFREALFKTNVLYGAPRFINSMLAWVEVVPEELKKDAMYRNPDMPLEEMSTAGRKLFNETYGSTATPLWSGSLISILTSYYAITLVYGPLYAFDGVLGALETSLAMIAALVGAEAPLQARWHIDGAMRHGATQADVDAVRKIANQVMKWLGREAEDV